MNHLKTPPKKCLGTLETTRLTSSPLGSNDYNDLRLIHGDPRCADPMAMEPLDEAYTADYVEKSKAHWAAHGFGMRMFRHKQDGSFVGFSGLRHSWQMDHDEIALGYAVCSTAWNRGFATEMNLAVLAEVFARPTIESVVAITFPENRNSRRVLEKAGLQYESDILHGGATHARYRIWNPIMEETQP